ncbi:phage tail length tape measure family protein [Sphaerotilus sp.]|uniref:phage tail length tape measure family protein n=1 Tax=Sphaerotilus sp. TaxID=2093942 RepID=UPI00286E1255|nr:phage tail length tape measure family protein [Sphaerotilus sp.]
MATRPIEGKIVLTADTDNAVHGAEAVKQAYQQAGAAAGASGTQAAAGQAAAAAATDKAAQAADHLGTEHQQAGAASTAAGNAAAAAAQRQAQSTQQATAAASGMTGAQERFLQQLRESADLYGKSTGEVLRYRAAQMGVAQQAEASIAALEKHGKAGQISAGQTAQAWQQLPMQMQDVAVSLAGGMNPLMVLMQQAPQITSSFGGVGNALKALGSIITPLRVASTGLAAGLVVVAMAALQGHEESTKLTKSLVLTGGAAGVTKGQVIAMGTSIAESQGMAVGKVRETMQALVDSGTFVGSSMASAGRAVTAVQKLTGASTDEIVKDFAGMKGGIAAWAAQHNDTYNHLSEDQYKYIRSLEAQGRTQEAMRVSMDALASAMEQRSVPALGSLERGWMAVGAALSGVWDKLKGIGREETAEERLKGLEARAARMRDNPDTAPRRGVTRYGVTGDRFAAEVQSEAETDLGNARSVSNSDAMRATEKSIAAQVTRDQIYKASKQYQDALLQVEIAGSQKLLAEAQADAQRRASVADASNAKGLLSVQAYASALNEVEQSRLSAQEAALKRQRGIEERRVEEKPEDGIAKRAALAQLDAQLTGVQVSIRKAVADGQNIVTADALQTARDRAQQWAAAWKAAADQVRSYAEVNQGTAAIRKQNPAERAEAEAQARTVSIRRQFGDQERDLKLAIDLIPDKEKFEQRLNEIGREQRDLELKIGFLPKSDKAGRAALQKQLDELKGEQSSVQVQIGLVPSTAAGSRAELKRQLKELTEQAGQQIDELGRAGKLDSYKAQYQELLASLQQAEAEIDQIVSAGELNTVDAERKKFAARAKALPQLQALVDKQRELAQTAGEKNDANAAGQQVKEIALKKTEIETTLKTSGQAAFSNFFRDVTSGAKTAGDALRDMVSGFAKSMLDLISKRMGEKLMGSMLDGLDGMLGGKGSGGSGAGLVSTAASWLGSFFHEGGVVGGGGGRTGSFPAEMWSFAPRYHTGGIAGLKPNEVPAVLMAGEEVLTADDPRHTRNGTSATRSMGPVSISISVSGAEGSTTDQSDAARDLGGMVEMSINTWATKQSRPGGILWKGK